MTGRWRELWSRLVATVSGRVTDIDLEAEFQSHLDHAAHELMEQGLPHDEASRVAAARFGSRLAARERAADQRLWPWLDHRMVDLRMAWRSLRASPVFTFGVVALLGLGVGINTAVFAAVHAALFKGFTGVPEQDRLVYLTTGRGCCVSYQDMLDWRAAATTVRDLAAVADRRVAVETATGSTTATATEVTANTFDLLGVRPRLGRGFTTDDDAPGAEAVALVSDLFWRRHLRAADDAVGLRMRVNGQATTVIGVMPEGFAFPQNQELWLPLGPRIAGQPRSTRDLWFAVGRLENDVTVADVRAEFDAIGRALAETYPDTNASVAPRVQQFSAMFLGPDATATYGALWAGVGILMAIAVVNLSTLQLARSAARSRQVGIQLALGAGRARVAGQQLCENLMLSAGGGLIGWGTAVVMLRVYQGISVPPTQPWASNLLDYSVDARVVAYLVATSTIAGLMAGWLPARGLSALEPLAAVRDGGRGTAGSQRTSQTGRLVIAVQVALAVILVAAAGVLVRSVIAVHNRPLGYDAGRAIVSLTMPPVPRYPEVWAQLDFYSRAAARLRALPGVETVALSESGVGASLTSFEIAGEPVAAPSERPLVRALAISGGYFEALGTTLVAGRDLTGEDEAVQRPVLIVNRAFEARHFGAGRALGRLVRVALQGDAREWLTIVGVAPDLAHGDRERATVEPTLYLPFRARPGRGAWLVTRTAGSPSLLINAVRRELQAVDPEVPVWSGPFTLDDWLASRSWRRGLNGALFSIFGLLAVALAASGLFAVTAGTVARRTQEIAVRVALGANRRTIGWLIARESTAPAVVGLVAGLLISTLTNQWLRAELVDVAPMDPVSLAAATCIMLAVTAVACVAPACRAMRIDPVQAIRRD